MKISTKWSDCEIKLLTWNEVISGLTLVTSSVTLVTFFLFCTFGFLFSITYICDFTKWISEYLVSRLVKWLVRYSNIKNRFPISSYFTWTLIYYTQTVFQIAPNYLFHTPESYILWWNGHWTEIGLRPVLRVYNYGMNLFPTPKLELSSENYLSHRTLTSFNWVIEIEYAK